ncbi:hypothetical protein PHLGIDRAFT_450103 [Phlebiopsis gigantea 11061_1 CR5-6]|uniref:Uncharacterized protein n=1 Tax=Phlebiopsis gigantea (strain 11061_1 CR5-6) TaxID=745531 RepID=A0A0C3S799_PHLG1|nr:hypothetical protein PHLGIDRAFT_450103 [Phlebiopsis gigantea 11061_1 CR5-6]
MSVGAQPWQQHAVAAGRPVAHAPPSLLSPSRHVPSPLSLSLTAHVRLSLSLPAPWPTFVRALPSPVVPGEQHGLRQPSLPALPAPSAPALHAPYAPAWLSPPSLYVCVRVRPLAPSPRQDACDAPRPCEPFPLLGPFATPPSVRGPLPASFCSLLPELPA